jgi:hypothetical protein
MTSMVIIAFMLSDGLSKNRRAQLVCHKRLKKIFFAAARSGTPFALYISEEKSKAPIGE